MGLFDKSNWFQVFSACLGKVMTIQDACAEQVVKGQGWNVDFSAGTLSFGRDSYPLQFIGSEANSDNTWLWGWKNVNGFDERLLRLTNFTYLFYKNSVISNSRKLIYNEICTRK